ncbi:hypothetical protein OV320_2610 [Actinobacteria bacterium OV320]|jgi:hypothetical protein|nr:hypothetical protein OV320_2610 [Actinobacteria bacterium OV320]
MPRTRPRAAKAAPKPTPKKTTPTPAAVDLRHLLKPRRRLFTGPMGPNEQAAIRAALDTARAALPIPVRTWNGSTANLTDGTLLTHNPGPDRLFTAHIACRHGAIHGYPITTHTDLREARALTHACERPHTNPTDDGMNWDKAITGGVHPAPAPKPGVVVQLREGIRRAAATKAETQPLTLADIAEGLAARTADAETAKEHPTDA